MPPRPADLVREFHAAFGLGIGGRPAEIAPVLAAHRQDLLDEEVTEVAEASRGGHLDELPRGRLPSTLAGVPQRPVPVPPAAPPALTTPCRASAAGLVWPVRVTAPQRRCASLPQLSADAKRCLLGRWSRWPQRNRSTFSL